IFPKNGITLPSIFGELDHHAHDRRRNPAHCSALHQVPRVFKLAREDGDPDGPLESACPMRDAKPRARAWRRTQRARDWIRQRVVLIDEAACGEALTLVDGARGFAPLEEMRIDPLEGSRRQHDLLWALRPARRAQSPAHVERREEGPAAAKAV